METVRSDRHRRLQHPFIRTHPLDIGERRLSSLSAATGQDHPGSSLGQIDGGHLPDARVAACEGRTHRLPAFPDWIHLHDVIKSLLWGFYTVGGLFLLKGSSLNNIVTVREASVSKNSIVYLFWGSTIAGTHPSRSRFSRPAGPGSCTASPSPPHNERRTRPLGARTRPAGRYTGRHTCFGPRAPGKELHETDAAADLSSGVWEDTPISC